MLHPSYSDLMNVVNSEVDVEHGEHPVVNSRYSIVMATSKRARQITDGEDPMVPVKDNDKALSIAVEELYQGKIKILTEEEEAEIRENAAEAEARAILEAEKDSEEAEPETEDAAADEA